MLVGYKYNTKEPHAMFTNKIIAQAFNQKVHCMTYFEEGALILLGFSKGMVLAYKEEKKGPLNTNLSKTFDLLLIAKIKVNSGRVTDLLVNGDRGEVYVLGQSNTLKIIDMVKWKVKDTINLSSSLIHKFFLDDSYQLGFFTNNSGKIHIVDMAGYKPVVSNTVEVCPTNISCIDCDLEAGLIVCAEGASGDVFLLDIEFPFSAVGSV